MNVQPDFRLNLVNIVPIMNSAVKCRNIMQFFFGGRRGGAVGGRICATINLLVKNRKQCVRACVRGCANTPLASERSTELM